MSSQCKVYGINWNSWAGQYEKYYCAYWMAHITRKKTQKLKKNFHHMCWKNLIACRLQSVWLCCELLQRTCFQTDKDVCESIVFLILSVMSSLSYHTCPQESLYPIRTYSNTERHNIQHNDKHSTSLLHIKNILCHCIRFLLLLEC